MKTHLKGYGYQDENSAHSSNSPCWCLIKFSGTAATSTCCHGTQTSIIDPWREHTIKHPFELGAIHNGYEENWVLRKWLKAFNLCIWVLCEGNKRKSFYIYTISVASSKKLRKCVQFWVNGTLNWVKKASGKCWWSSRRLVRTYIQFKQFPIASTLFICFRRKKEKTNERKKIFLFLILIRVKITPQTRFGVLKKQG